MSSTPALNRRSLAWAAILLATLAVAPLWLPSYPLVTLTRILVFALLAVSLDVLVGYTGLPSLGHGAYFGAGAYAAGWVAIHMTQSATLTLLVASASGAAAAAIAGSVAVRAQGVFFLMLTLALGEMAHQLAESWQEVTGGSNGLYGIPAVHLGTIVLLSARAVYWWVLSTFVSGVAVLGCVAASPFGETLRGIRDNEGRMRALGYRVYHYKLAAFILSGAFAGMAGGLLATHQRLVTPADGGLGTSTLALFAVIIGGEASLSGACLGAALVVLIRDSLGASLGGRGPLVLGVVFVAVVYLLPSGLAGALRPAWRR